jgi:hypothetical protein
MATGAVVARILSQYSDKGSKEAQKDIQKLGKKIDEFGKKATKSFAVAGIATAAFAGKLALDAVRGAAADEKALTALDVALRNNTNATDAAISANANFLDALELQVAIDNEQLIPALQTLATATGDLGQAQALLSLSTDVSAASGKDLGAVSMALSKAVNGNFTALKKLGLPLDEDAIKAKDLGAILVQLSKISEGQAAAAANTFAGKLEKLRLSINQVKDRLGIALMPGLIVLATYIQDKIVPQLEYFIYLNQYKISSALESTVKNIQDTAHAFGNIYAVIDKVNNILPLGIGGYIQLGAVAYAAARGLGVLNFAVKAVQGTNLKAMMATKMLTTDVEKNARAWAKLDPTVRGAANVLYAVKSAFAATKTSIVTTTTAMIASAKGMGFFAGATAAANTALIEFIATMKSLGVFLAKYVKQIAIALVVMGAIYAIYEKFIKKEKAALSPKAQAIEYNIYKTTVMKGLQSMDMARDAAIKKQEEQNSKTKEQIEQERLLAAMEAKSAKEAAKNARAVALRDAVLARLKKLNAVPGTGKAKIGKSITPVSSLDAAEYEAINFRAAELLLLKQKDNETELKKLAALKENILLQEIRNTLSLRYVDILRVIADEKITDAEVKALAMGWKLPEQAVRAYLIQFQAVADGTISDDEVIQLAKSWGSTKEQAAQYLDFFAFLNDGVLSDAEIEKLKSKWKLTEDQVRQYADFVGVVNDGKLTDSEIQKLMSKWKMTTDEVVAYIVKIGSPVSYSGTLISPAQAAELAWKSATAALDEYLRKLGQGTSSSSSSSSSSSAAASADATKEAADAAAAAADAAAALAAANSAATAAALAAADAILGTNSGNNYSGDDGIARRAAAAGLATKNAEETARIAALAKQDAQNAAKAEGLAKRYGGFVGSSTIDNAASMGSSSSNSGVVVNLTVTGSVSTEQDLVSAVRNGLLATQTNGNTLTLQAV